MAVSSPPSIPQRGKKMVEFLAEAREYSLADFVEKFGHCLPQCVIVKQGFCGDIIEDTFDRDQVLWLCAVSKQTRVLTKANSDICSIPLSFSPRVCIVDEHGRVSEDQPLEKVLSHHSLPVTIQFPRDTTITVGNRTVATNNLPNITLIKSFDEIYLLGNYIANGVMDDSVVAVPLYLTQVRISRIRGIQGSSDEQWLRYQHQLRNKSTSIEYDMEFGNPNIASYKASAISSKSEYTYVQPSTYSSSFQFLQDARLKYTSTKSTPITRLTHKEYKYDDAGYVDLDQIGPREHLQTDRQCQATRQAAVQGQQTRWKTDHSQVIKQATGQGQANRLTSGRAQTTRQGNDHGHVIRQAHGQGQANGLTSGRGQTTRQGTGHGHEIRQTHGQGQANILETDQGQATRHATAQGQENRLANDQGQATVHATARGQENTLATDQGQATVHATARGQENRLATDQGQAIRHATAQGQENRLTTDQGQENRLATDQGQATRHATAQGHENRLATDQGQATRHATAQEHENRLANDQGQAIRHATAQGQEHRLATRQIHGQDQGTEFSEELNYVVTRKYMPRVPRSPPKPVAPTTLRRLDGTPIPDRDTKTRPISLTASASREKSDNIYTNNVPRLNVTPTVQDTMLTEIHGISSKETNVEEILKIGVNDAKKVEELTMKEVGDYLKALKLHTYVGKFQEEMVDGRILKMLDICTLMDVFHLNKIEAIRLVSFAENGHIPK